ncbi:MAG: Stress response protein SCP2 [Candidatus Ordinivivax streblomastigis]|uniref:Stress response protein SCP2 n=1 Tax=Candidatus Ordinivivax streblomastigis TaxID=2540710 RepID=A0A5M8NXW4_9BACT|nr:MAG: Stress response protein SCP2 [Candidatus Ordinivivax streblomastigis]
MAIKLEKGQRINLEKGNGNKLQNICVGVNWGAIAKKGFWGNTKIEAVDLDASCATFDDSNKSLEVIYFGNLKSKNGSIKHSGDDLTGDMGGDDGLDNEVITVDLAKLPAEVSKIAFVLNSFRGHDFKTIPYASIRIYEGTPTHVNELFATYDIANDASFSGSVSMIMGVFYKRNGEWKFNAIGEATRDLDLKGTLATVASKYL